MFDDGQAASEMKEETGAVSVTRVRSTSLEDAKPSA